MKNRKIKLQYTNQIPKILLDPERKSVLVVLLDDHGNEIKKVKGSSALEALYKFNEDYLYIK